MDVTACILGDIIKPGDKLGNTLGRQIGQVMKITKLPIFEYLFSMLKTGVCGEYGLNFCTWTNCLTCHLMGKACEVKAGIIKEALLRDNHKWYKTCKFDPFLCKCYLLVNW